MKRCEDDISADAFCCSHSDSANTHLTPLCLFTHPSHLTSLLRERERDRDRDRDRDRETETERQRDGEGGGGGSGERERERERESE